MEAPEIEIARYATKISWVALGVSGASAFIAAGALALEVRRWFDEGVKLSLTFIVDGKFFGGGLPDKNTYLSITAMNRGDAATTLTHMVLYHYPSALSAGIRWAPPWLIARAKGLRPKTMLVPRPEANGGSALPHLLKPGCFWMGTVVHTPDLESMIASKRLFAGVIGSHSDQPILRRVRRWRHPKNKEDDGS